MFRHIAVIVMLMVVTPIPLYAQNVQFRVTAATADVHGGPTVGSPVIGKASRGDVFEVTRNLGSWVRIAWPEAPEGNGYLHVSWGTLSGGSRPAALVPVPADSESSAPTGLAQRRTVRGTTNPEPAPAAPLLSLPSHLIGVGGALHDGRLGFAATGRAWSRNRLGVQIEIGHVTRTNAGAATRLTSAQFAQSLIYSLPDVVTNAIWVRPYVGGGVNVYHSNLTSVTPGIIDAIDSGFAYQLLGGAEFTWASIPQIAVSAGFRRQFAPTTPAAFDLGSFGFSMSAHWYIR